jgi:hypothetical protein
MRHWDMWQRKVSPIASRVPLLVCRGNHELWYSFAAYKARLGLSMPLPADPATGQLLPSNNGSYYSLNIGAPGALHLAVFNTETVDDTADIDSAQLAWLEADLAAARANASGGWIVIGAHRPFYCTNGGGKDTDCGTYAPLLRGLAEKALISSRTDLSLSAHMHGYERLFPCANGAPVSTNYSSPQAPVYIVNGAAGNREGNEDPSANAACSVPGGHTGEIGYAVLTVASSSAPGASYLKTAFYRSSDNALLDNFTITK